MANLEVNYNVNVGAKLIPSKDCQSETEKLEQNNIHKVIYCKPFTQIQLAPTLKDFSIIVWVLI